MEQKEELLKETQKRFDNRNCTEGTRRTVEKYYELCEYDLDKMSFETYCDFVKNDNVLFTDAVFSRNIIRNVLTISFDANKALWPAKNYHVKLLENINFENEIEKNNIIRLSEWNEFSLQMESVLKQLKKRGMYKKYLVLCMSWHGIQAKDMGKLVKEDIAVENDVISIYVERENKTYLINDECALEGMRLVLSYDNEMTHPFKNPSKFIRSQLDKLQEKIKSKVLERSPLEVYMSGMYYRISMGYTPVVAEDNTALLAYYKAMSRFLYGEPLNSGEPTSAEPQQTPPDKIDVEKEAEKYILDWQWERFASQVEAMIDLLRLDRLEPFFEYYLAWNGIPVELISLLTPKNISTNGEDRIYITDGRHEIEIEASKNTALKLQDFILVAGDKVFEEIQGYTEETLPRLFIGARDLGFTNTVEEIYISGILYRLAKFGQEPDDKENLNYYKAVADYIYKGDD